MPHDVSPAKVAKIIEDSAIQREWKVMERKPGALLLSQERPDYSVKVEVDYDADSIRIRYVDSSGVSTLEDEGFAPANTTYSRWVHNLAIDINVGLINAAPAP